MKKALIAAVSVTTLIAMTPALAQAQTAPTGVYGNLGYSSAKADDLNLGAIQGRLGYRANDWLGVEGELALGVKDDKSRQVVAGTPVDTRVELKHQEAIYAVGFAPITPQADLIARVGYGNTKAKASATAVGAGGPVTVSETADGDSWNFGVGAQYHWDTQNGVRVDYTRHEFRDDDAGHADVWSVAYSRRF